MIIVALAALSQLPSLIPAPESYRALPGSFRIQRETRIVASGAAKPVAERLRRYLKPATGFDLPVESRRYPLSIELRLDLAIGETGDEGYRLVSKPDGITIVASKPAGLFYGVQSLRQLLPTAAFSRRSRPGENWTVPACEIVDRPRFGWRGLHLDVSRHFYGVDFIKEYIDWLAAHKMNVFHWHLTDDGGWRMEVKKYPKLTEVGAWREPQPVEWSYGGLRFPGKSSGKQLYGGFYTQAQIREVVKYAAERYVTVVPEIELPGHSTETVASYPELLVCDPSPDVLAKYIASTGNDQPSMVCVGKDSSVEFFKNVLDEVIDLFPSKFIHIGGDEVPKDLWAVCNSCKARMSSSGLKDTHELQSWFIQQFDTYLAGKGRRLIGWDEILEGGLAPGATVMSWRGIAGGIQAAKANHDVVMSPTSHCYFDYPYSTISTKSVYGYGPIPSELTANESKRILGAQGNVWTEWLSTEEEIEMMVFPRGAALAEAVWTHPSQKNWEGFLSRLAQHYERLDHLGIAYFMEPPIPKSEVVMLSSGDPVSFDASTVPESVVRYTVDGSDPTSKSPVYRGPIRMNRGGVVKAAIFRPNGSRSEVTSVGVVSLEPDSTPKIPGLRRRVLTGTFPRCPDPNEFASSPAVPVSDIALGDLAGQDNFAVLYEGFLRIPADGKCTFFLGSDDGSRMWLGEAPVIDNDGLHGFVEKRLRIKLPKGDYPFRIVMFEQAGAERLSLTCAVEEGSPRAIPADWLWSRS